LLNNKCAQITKTILMNLTPSVSSLATFSLFADKEGRLWSCGTRLPGQLPGFINKANQIGNFYEIPLPAHLEGTITSTACGFHHTLVLTSCGSLLGWGINDNYQLGPGGDKTTMAPIPIPSSLKVVKIACGAFSSAFITEDGNLYLWGGNPSGELGQGHRDDLSEPSRVSLPSPVLSVGLGYAHAAALTDDGRVWTWGRNDYGELGLGTGVPEALTPTLVPEIPEAVSIYVSHGTYVRTKSGDWWGWGWNGLGALGIGEEINVMYPTLLPWSRPDVVALAYGGVHAMALLEDSSILVWGGNNHGQLGLGFRGSSSQTNSPSLLPFPSASPPASPRSSPPSSPPSHPPVVAAIGCLNDHSYLVTTKGQVYVWGSDCERRLGVGEEDLLVPTLVEGFVASVPKSKEREWAIIFRWLFLGRLEAESPFGRLPVEVFFHFVGVWF
jgi:alpha-tubulin suppressor-like RCC1 family protein